MKPARVIVLRDVKPANDQSRTIETVVIDLVDPARRRRIGDALLRILKSTGTPDKGGHQ